MKLSKRGKSKELAKKALVGTGKIAWSGSVAVTRIARNQASDFGRRHGRLSVHNWYAQAAPACESVSDAILRKPGLSKRIATMTVGKLSGVAAPAAIFSIATLVGTASTGTAIGSLSGAAFTSATFAWIGGTVAAGTAIITGVGLVAAAAGAFGANWIGKKYVFGKPRSTDNLSTHERRIVDACMSLAVAFRNEQKAARAAEPVALKALYDEALLPLSTQLQDYQPTGEDWPPQARRRLEAATKRFKKFVTSTGHIASQQPAVTTGIVSAVIIQLLADDIPNFDASEQIVLDALRRSNRSLTDATEQELAAYIQSLEPNQLAGLRNNLLGISHELRYFVEENSDGDEYIVELFSATNHPGADARIINTITGDVREVQLKASQYMSYVNDHNERYAHIPAMATDELAAQSDHIESTGISYEDLDRDVGTVVTGMGDFDDPSVLASMSMAAMLTLARNVNVLLKDDALAAEKKTQLIKEGAASAVIAGLVHTVIG